MPTGLVPGSDDGRSRTAVVLLAVSLLAVELVAGLQTYLAQTVLPLAATDLNGVQLYGVVSAAAQAAVFLTMPLGGSLLSRVRVGPLLLIFTLVMVLGAVVCALAPTMPVFVVGTMIRALAAGALATVSMGAVGQGLPPRFRHLVLAGMSGVWVVSSLAGPAYAAFVSSWLGWRWAMVIYLPALLLARMMVARYLPPRAEEASRERVPWGWAAMLALGAVVVAVPAGAWTPGMIVLGGPLMLWAARSLLPAGALRGIGARPAALSALLVTTGVYFGASAVLAVIAHDAFGLPAARFAFVLAAPAFLWALSGMWCGTRPAAGAALHRRMLTGGAATILGVAVLLATTVLAGLGRGAGAGRGVWPGLVLGAAVLGLGMGMIYPDLLGLCFTEPTSGDGISPSHMAAAVVLSEAVGTALVTTIAFNWLGTGFGLSDRPVHRAQLLYVGILLLTPLMIMRLGRATPAVDPRATGPQGWAGTGPEQGRARMARRRCTRRMGELGSCPDGGGAIW